MEKLCKFRRRSTKNTIFFDFKPTILGMLRTCLQKWSILIRILCRSSHGSSKTTLHHETISSPPGRNEDDANHILGARYAVSGCPATAMSRSTVKLLSRCGDGQRVMQSPASTICLYSTANTSIKSGASYNISLAVSQDPTQMNVIILLFRPRVLPANHRCSGHTGAARIE